MRVVSLESHPVLYYGFQPPNICNFYKDIQLWTNLFLFYILDDVGAFVLMWGQTVLHVGTTLGAILSFILISLNVFQAEPPCAGMRMWRHRLRNGLPFLRRTYHLCSEITFWHWKHLCKLAVFTVRPVFKTTWKIRTTWELRSTTSVPIPIQYIIVMVLRNKTTTEVRTVFDSPLGVLTSQLLLYFNRKGYISM